jgi:hypothetical protein
MGKKRPPNRVETLPSGIVVAFWDEVGLDGKPQRRRYRIPGPDGELYPSISTISGIYEKHGLVPSAVNLTLEGVIAVAESGVKIGKLSPSELASELRERELHHDSIWGAARERGHIAHEHLLHLLRDGKVAKLSDYPLAVRPWIQAGMKWALDFEPEIFQAEYFVASIVHGFAGRGDLFCRPQKSLWTGMKSRVDFKTVTEWKFKRNRDGTDSDQLLPPYDENLIGLAGYDCAAPESGYEESEARLIVRLGPDGDYVVTESHATEEVFLAALTAYKERRYLSTGRPEGS